MTVSQNPDTVQAPPSAEAKPPQALAQAGVRAGPSRSARLVKVGYGVLVFGLLLLVAWMALAPLDEGVPAQGLVSVDTKRKTIQHLQGGIIKKVLVREGQDVKQDQVLMELDDATARANYEAVRQKYLGLRALESRLLAEQQGLDLIEFHADLMAAQQDPLIAKHMSAQRELFQTRKAALRAELQAIEESIRGQEAMVQSYTGMIENRQRQRQLFQEQLSSLRGLVEQGYAPKNQQLELERQLAEVTSVLAELQGNLLRARQTIAESRHRAVARQQDYRKETDSQLADTERDVQSDRVRYQALRDDLDRMQVRSPVAGQVVGLTFQTLGGVIPPGQRIMDIVPEGESLILEVRVSPGLIDRIKPGLVADVRFTAFSQSPLLVVQGEVMSVSGDLLSEQTAQGMTNYFLARVKLTPQGVAALGPHQIQPGMPAEVVIRTGERTVLTYLLHPFVRRVASSMKER